MQRLRNKTPNKNTNKLTGSLILQDLVHRFGVVFCVYPPSPPADRPQPLAPIPRHANCTCISSSKPCRQGTNALSFRRHSKRGSRAPLLVSEVDIAALAIDPPLPRDAIRLLEVAHPALGIEQRARPAGLVEQLAELSEPAGGAVADIAQVGRERDSKGLVLVFGASHELLGGAVADGAARQRPAQNRRRHPRAHLVLVARERQQRRAAPQHVGGCRVRVALRRVQEQVTYARARDVHVLGGHVRKDDAAGHLWWCPLARRFEEVSFAVFWEAEKPEYGFGYFVQDTEPGAEGCWFDLVAMN